MPKQIKLWQCARPNQRNGTNGNCSLKHSTNRFLGKLRADHSKPIGRTTDYLTTTANIKVPMKKTVAAIAVSLCLVGPSKSMAYSGELWLSQAETKFAQPASMLAHGFLAGVVHSWNGRRGQKNPQLCFDSPASELQIRNLMAIVKDYISKKSPDLKVSAQGIIRAAMMTEFPCR